jgi:uncharacterized protein YdeI (YjbR/CyaY-like superfamily)
MASVTVDPAKVHEFVDAAAFFAWLSEHHDRETEVWVKMHKVRSGRASVSPAQAIDVVLCWGWIDAIRKRFDDLSFLQRYTRRGSRSTWSQLNVANVERLAKEGRMTEHGLTAVRAAKADGRWGRAYGSGKAMKLPDDFSAAIAAAPGAANRLLTLSERNRFAMALAVHNLKTPAGRARRIATFVAMLQRGETPFPQAARKR